jgi:putative transposase
MIDRQTLHRLCGFSDYARFTAQHSRWVHEAITGGSNQRERCWTESIAVGSQKFIEETKARLGIEAKGRRIEGHPDELYVLREESVTYNADFARNL